MGHDDERRIETFCPFRLEIGAAGYNWQSALQLVVV